MTHNELVRALSPKHRLKGSDVNSWLYTYADRFFVADREPTEGLPKWSLSVGGRQRLKASSRSTPAQARTESDAAPKETDSEFMTPAIQAVEARGASARPSTAGESFDAKALRRSRKQRKWTQHDLATRLGVSRSLISQWEKGRALPNPSQAAKLRELFSTVPVSVAKAPVNHRGKSSAMTFGDWVAEQRMLQGVSQGQLAQAAGVSMQSISNIETGRTPNPRPSTRRRIEQALGEDLPAPIASMQTRESEIEGIGEYQDFDPHDKEDYPSEPGVYVFYDRSDRPIYVGRSENIARRVRQHSEKFWFKAPIVDRAAFIPVADAQTRNQIESVLIKFLRSNAVLNQKGTDT